MAKDKSGIKESCPYIDTAIHVLDDCRCTYTDKDIQVAISELEIVREIASDLREWGNEQFHYAKSLEDEILELKRIIEKYE